MKIFSIGLVLLLLLGGLAWWYRDLLPLGDGGESVEVSEEAAAMAVGCAMIGGQRSIDEAACFDASIHD